MARIPPARFVDTVNGTPALTHLATFATNGSVLIASAGFGPSTEINRVTTCFAADVSMPRKISFKTVAALASAVLFSLRELRRCCS